MIVLKVASFCKQGKLGVEAFSSVKQGYEVTPCHTYSREEGNEVKPARRTTFPNPGKVLAKTRSSLTTLHYYTTWFIEA